MDNVQFGLTDHNGVVGLLNASKLRPVEQGHAASIQSLMAIPRACLPQKMKVNRRKDELCRRTIASNRSRMPDCYRCPKQHDNIQLITNPAKIFLNGKSVSIRQALDPKTLKCRSVGSQR
jgi:hypothetical protein